jgi:predicted Zn-ribbon and HTH transcriptional regulator
MKRLTTIYSSNAPVDCYIVKGRLETEGIPCFIFDEHTISVHPFRAVAIGGVKLKVPVEKITQSQNILSLIEKNKLIDESGEYLVSEIFDNEIKRQNDVLTLKHKIRSDRALLEEEIDYRGEYIERMEIEEIIKQEREFLSLSDKKFSFSWNQFFYELFDFERSVFKYLRTKPVNYYLDKELVENYGKKFEKKEACHCPRCNSDNVAYGYAIDYKWDFTYLIISLLTVPLFLIRKKHHCFDCGFNFKKQRTATANMV